MTSGIRFSLVGVVLLTYLVAGALYVTLTPNWQAPDEPAHYNYIRYLAAKTGFPELVAGCYDQTYLNKLTSHRFPAELPIDNVCYEFHQPPLYYLLATPLFVLSNGSLTALRLFSVALGGGVVVLAFFTARIIFPDRDAVSFGAMAFTAFVPMHVAVLSSVNNDALAELIVALLLFLLTRRLLSTGMVSIKNDLLLGLLLGAGLITKATAVLITVPLVAAMLWFKANRPDGRKTKIDWPDLLKHAAIIYGLALIIGAPWFIRNAALYGGFDIYGLGRHDEVVVGQLRTADFLAKVGGATYIGNFITTTFHSFWGQFGWMAVPMDGRTYLLLTLLTVIALAGLGGFWILDFGFWILTAGLARFGVLRKPASFPPVWLFHHLSVGQRQAVGLVALAVLLMALGYVGYNLTFVQFQGRYLFPSLIPLALFFSLGLEEALNRRWAWQLAGGLTLALAWVAVDSGLSGSLDKWAVLIIGLALGLVAGRFLIAHRWSKLTPWLLVACYISLGLLTLAGPFWFIVPYL